MKEDFLSYLISGSNYPPQGSISFESSDHIRFQNGVDVSGHNYGCRRRFVIEKDIEDGEGYTVTLYNLDGLHPLWQNNIQMAPKRMKIEKAQDNVIELRGYGFDSLGGDFSNYGMVLLVEGRTISRVQLNMYDRNISIVYLQ